MTWMVAAAGPAPAAGRVRAGRSMLAVVRRCNRHNYAADRAWAAACRRDEEVVVVGEASDEGAAADAEARSKSGWAAAGRTARTLVPAAAREEDVVVAVRMTGPVH